jgi:prefoldin subunit 5
MLMKTIPNSLRSASWVQQLVELIHDQAQQLQEQKELIQQQSEAISALKKTVEEQRDEINRLKKMPKRPKFRPGGGNPKK